MNIYFIENENPSRNSSGGVMSYLINLSHFLIKYKVNTTLIGSGELKDKNMKLFSNFMSVSKQQELSNPKFLLHLFKKSFNFEKGSIIHAQRPDMLVPLIYTGKKKRCKLVCSLHGSHDIAVFDKKGYLHGIFYTLFQTISFIFADKLIAVDEKSKQHFIKKYPWIKKKIIVIPIGVNTQNFFPTNKKYMREKYGFSASDKILIFVGRLEKEKNITFLISSFKIVKEKIPSAKLLLIGSGRDTEKLKLYVKNKHIPDVIFWGEVSNTIIPALMNCADIFVFASLYEGSPTVIKEALSCNIPVVSVDVGDVKSVIKNINHCYIAQRNIEDFALKIITLLSNDEPKEINKKIHKFSNDNVFKKTLDIYNSLVGKK